MNHSEISSFIGGTADLLRSSFKQHEYGDILAETRELEASIAARLEGVLQ